MVSASHAAMSNVEALYDVKFKRRKGRHTNVSLGTQKHHLETETGTNFIKHGAAVYTAPVQKQEVSWNALSVSYDVLLLDVMVGCLINVRRCLWCGCVRPCGCWVQCCCHWFAKVLICYIEVLWIVEQSLLFVLTFVPSKTPPTYCNTHADLLMILPNARQAASSWVTLLAQAHTRLQVVRTSQPTLAVKLQMPTSRNPISALASQRVHLRLPCNARSKLAQ